MPPALQTYSQHLSQGRSLHSGINNSDLNQPFPLSFSPLTICPLSPSSCWSHLPCSSAAITSPVTASPQHPSLIHGPKLDPRSAPWRPRSFVCLPAHLHQVTKSSNRAARSRLALLCRAAPRDDRGSAAVVSDFHKVKQIHTGNTGARLPRHRLASFHSSIPHFIAGSSEAGTVCAATDGTEGAQGSGGEDEEGEGVGAGQGHRSCPSLPRRGSSAPAGDAPRCRCPPRPGAAVPPHYPPAALPPPPSPPQDSPLRRLARRCRPAAASREAPLLPCGCRERGAARSCAECAGAGRRAAVAQHRCRGQLRGGVVGRWQRQRGAPRRSAPRRAAPGGPGASPRARPPPSVPPAEPPAGVTAAPGVRQRPRPEACGTPRAEGDGWALESSGCSPYVSVLAREKGWGVSGVSLLLGKTGSWQRHC